MANMSKFRWVTDWPTIRQEIVSSDCLEYNEKDYLIIQVITPENVESILAEIPRIDPVILESLGETVMLFDVDEDFTETGYCLMPHRLSFIDEHGQLTPHFRRGLEVLKGIQSTHPELLPPTNDRVTAPSTLTPEQLRILRETHEEHRRILREGTSEELDRLL